HDASRSFAVPPAATLEVRGRAPRATAPVLLPARRDVNVNLSSWQRSVPCSSHEARDGADRRLLEWLVRHAFEQGLGRPDGLQTQQLGGEMRREDRKINHMADDDDGRDREDGRA